MDHSGSLVSCDVRAVGDPLCDLGEPGHTRSDVFASHTIRSVDDASTNLA